MSNYSVSWIKQHPQLNTSGTEASSSIVSDSLGNLYVTYSTDGAVSGGSRNGSNDIVVVKMSTDGSLLWIKQQPVMSTFAADTVPEIDIDSTGNCYVIYQTAGTVSSGSLKGSTDVVIFKMDTNGNLVWIKQLLNMNTSLADEVPSIAVDPSGNCYGTYSSTGIVSGGSINNGSYDIVIFKLDTNGTLAWIQRHPATNASVGEGLPSIGVDKAGNSYVAYYTEGGTVSGGANKGLYDIVIFKMDTDGQLLWVKQHVAMNSTNYDYTPSLAVDSAGSVYVSYMTYGIVSGGTFLGGLIDIAVIKMSSDGQLQWIKQQSTMNTTGQDTSPSIAVDSAGRVYVSYFTNGIISGGTNVGSNDIVVFMMDRLGNVISVYQQSVMSSAGSEEYPSITTDSLGNCYVSYQTGGTISGGSRSGLTDIVVFKLARTSPPNYTVSWIKQHPQLNTGTSELDPRIVSDSLGNLYLTYYGGGPVSGGVLNNNSYDIVVVKMSADGNILWIKQQPVMSTSAFDSKPTIAIDSAGNCYVLYKTDGTVSSGTNAGLNDIAIFKLDTNGNLLWINQLSAMNTPSTEESSSIAVDLSGNCYGTYRTDGIVSGGTNLGSYDIVVFKMDTNGTLAWIKQQSSLSTSVEDAGPSIGVDKAGNSYVAYSTNGGTVLGGSNQGSWDIVVFKMATDGQLLWTQQQALINTTGTESNPSLAVDTAGNCYVAYSTNGGTVSGGTNVGYYDIVVFKMATDGTVVWIKQQSATNTAVGDFNPSIAVDIAGRVYVSYQTTGTVSGGTNKGSDDIVVFMMDVFGNIISVYQQSVLSTAGSDLTPSIAADSAGNCYVSYKTLGSVSGGSNAGFDDIVVFKMAPYISGLPANYTVSWIKQYPQLNTGINESNSRIVSDPVGNLFLTYSTAGTVSGGTRGGVEGFIDIVVVKMGSDGTILWIKQQIAMNTVTTDTTPQIATDSSGNCYVAYKTIGTVSGGTFKGGLGDVVIFKSDTNGNLIWIKQLAVMNTTLEDRNLSIAVDRSGNCYVGYDTNGSVSGGSNRGNYDVVVFKLSTNGNLVWIQQYPAVSTSDFELRPSIGVDNADNSYVAYYTGGTVSGGTFIGGYDIVVIKIDSNGQILWVKQQAVMNSTGNDQNPSIAVDSAGNVYVSYYTTGQVSGGTFLGGTNDIVVFKMDTNGQLLWVKQQSVMNSSGNDMSPAIAVDIAGRIYVSYQTNGVVNGGINMGSNDIVVFMMDTFGNLVSVNQQPVMSTTGSDTVPSITTDSLENCYVSYQTLGSVSGGSNKGPTDIVVFKMTPYIPEVVSNYTVSWIKQYPQLNTSASDQYSDIVSDSLGNLYLTYQTGGTVSGGSKNGSYDIVVVKMSADGNILWIKQQPVMSTFEEDTVPEIDIDSSGNCYVIYQTIGTVSGGSLKGSTDVVIFKMDTNGNLVWINQLANMNTALADVDPSIAVDPSGNCYGTYSSTGIVSGGSANNGSYDIVIFKLDTNGTLAWIQRYPNVNTNSAEARPSIGVDKAGNSYVAYDTIGTVSGGTRIGTYYNIIVFKLSTNGQLQWIKQQPIMNTTRDNQYPSLAVDSSGSVYVSYITDGTVSGGTFISPDNMTYDIAVFKMDTNGNVVWIKQESIMNTTEYDLEPSIAVDKVGRVYVSYSSNGTVSGGTNTTGTFDIVVFMMDEFGNIISVYQQSVMSSIAGSDYYPSITTDSLGNCYVSYHTDGSVSGESNKGFTDIVVFKMAQGPPSLIITQIAGGISASWMNALVGVPFTSYEVSLYADLQDELIVDGELPLQTIQTSSSPVFFAGLIYGTLYTISLSGYNGSAYLPVSVASYRFAALPSPPRNVTVSVQESQAIVSWADPLDMGAGSVTKYTVTSDNTIRAVAFSENTAVVSGLAPGSSHTFSVYAENTYGTTSATANSAVVPTTPDIIPPVPFPDCTPWVWFDAADPTTIVSNGTSLTWWNKGTGGDGASTSIGTDRRALTGVDTLNNRNVVTLTPGASLSVTMKSLSNSSFMGFFVVRPTTDIGATGGKYMLFGDSFGTRITPYFGVDSVSNNTCALKTAVSYQGGVSDLTRANLPNQYYEPGLYCYIQTDVAEANYIGLNGSGLTINLPSNTTTTIDTVSFNSYNLGDIEHQTSLQYAEAVVFSGVISTSQRVQMEGYLAWKWGLQAKLPADHPYSLTNYKETMAALLRPRSFVSTFAGSGAQATLDGTGTDAQFDGPHDLVEDSQGNIFVVEPNSSNIRKITPAGDVTTFSTVDGSTYGITIDSNDNLYIATTHAILKATPDQMPVTTIAGLSGTSGDAVGTGANARFNTPTGMTFDLSGNLYVCDGSNNKIKKIIFAPDGSTSVSVFAGPAVGTTATGDVVGTGTAVRFNSPRGIACDSNGNLFVCDQSNNKIKKITPAGQVSVFAGPAAGTTTAGNVDGLGTDAQFNAPYGISIDRETNYMYVSEIGINRIRRISPSGIVTTCVGPGPGVANTSANTDGIDTVARFTSTRGLTRAKDGTLYVADFGGNRIRKVSFGANNQVGTYLTGLTTPDGIVLDRNGTLYITEFLNRKISKVTQHGVKSDFAGSGLSGFADGLATAATFQAPRCLVLDNYDNLYVSDSSNRNIRRITKAGVVTTFAGHVGIGTSGTYYLDATGTAARFDVPYALTIDKYGNIYVADLGNGTGNNNRRIRKITPKGIVTTVAGSGLSGSGDGVGTDASFGNLLGITADALDNLMVCDGRRLRKINDQGLAVSIVGNNTIGSTDGIGSAASFNNISGGTFDQYGNLYINDKNANLVRKITPEGAATRIAGSTMGTSDGIGIAASFNEPSQICYDSYNSYLYVSDRANSTIRGIKIYPSDPLPYTNNSHTTIQGLSNDLFMELYGQITFIPR